MTTQVATVWDAVIGQPTAVRRLQASAVSPLHAYLFVGPPGSSKNEAARAFAARLMSAGDDPSVRAARLALNGEHPDVREVMRVGPAISAEQADDIVRMASLAPTEGNRKVMILHEFHLINPMAAAKLLKTIEEPPGNTVFIVLADHMPADLVTIASRCIRIDFVPVSNDVVAATLRAEGVGADRALEAATAAQGRPRRRASAGCARLAPRSATGAGASRWRSSPSAPAGS